MDALEILRRDAPLNDNKRGELVDVLRSFVAMLLWMTG